MMDEVDNLIRDAKPEVPALAREGVLAHLRAHGVVVYAPASIRPLPVRHSPGVGVLRVAALVVLALFAGVAAALVTPPSSSLGESRDVAVLAARVYAFEQNLPTAQVKALSEKAEALNPPASDHGKLLDRVIADAIHNHEQRKAEEWRERHVRHLRNAYAEQADATVERLRKELGLATEQEREVRALLAEAEKQAEALIGDFYTHGHHPNPQVREKFVALATDTEKKLDALLDRQQREKMAPEKGIVSASPADWAPNSEFRDGTDLDVWTNWVTATSE
jgi:hypothetical protein